MHSVNHENPGDEKLECVFMLLTCLNFEFFFSGFEIVNKNWEKDLLNLSKSSEGNLKYAFHPKQTQVIYCLPFLEEIFLK